MSLLALWFLGIERFREQSCTESMRDGAVNYLAKPIDPQQLRAALSRWAAAAPPVAGQRPVTA